MKAGVWLSKLKIILDEKEYASIFVTEDGSIRKLPLKDMRLDYAVRYLYQIVGLKPKQIEEAVIDYYSSVGILYIDSVRQDYLDLLTHKTAKRLLTVVPPIQITKKELDVIDQVDGIMYQRVLFTMLCLAKYQNAKNGDDMDWENFEISSVFKLANNTATNERKGKILGKLIRDGYIDPDHRAASSSYRLTFVDHKDDDVVLYIDDFRDLGYQYEKYKGGQFGVCKICGRLFRLKKKINNPTHCNDCQTKYQNRHGNYYVPKVSLVDK